jgi:hypothetical protein
MSILLRLVAGYTFFVVVFTARLIVEFSRHGQILPLLKSGPLGIVTVTGWLITLFFGVPAAVLLWRKKDLGRFATGIVLGSIGLYYVISLTFFNSHTNEVSILLRIFFSGVMVALVLSPAARRLCQSQ